MGMKGTTSTAPIRGCSPWWRRRSIRGIAASKRASTPARIAGASPTKVRTLRLCAASDDTSSSRMPVTPRTAAAIASIEPLSRPSEMFGTHSMIVGMPQVPDRAVYNHRQREHEQRTLPGGLAAAPMSSTAVPGSYPGNPALPKEVREKILSTFRHTLNLFKEGKTDDCVIGCDFILKMDPRFAPARQLMEKAKNPAAAVDVAELEIDRRPHARPARSGSPPSTWTSSSSARPRA